MASTGAGKKGAMNVSTEITPNIFNVPDDELMKDLPPLTELQEPMNSSKSPLELQLASETKAGAGTQNQTPPAPETVSTGQTNTAPPKNNTPPKVEKEGEIEYKIPQHTTTQTQPNPDANKNNFTQFQDNGNQQTQQQHNFSGPDMLDEGVWNISELKDPKSPGGGGSASSGGPIPESEMGEFMEDANADLADTAIILYESMWLDGLKEGVKIDIPDFISEMTILNIEKGVQRDFLLMVIEYNKQIDQGFAITPQKKAMLKHALTIVLNKYSGFAENITPELQALMIIGRVLWKDYSTMRSWKNPSKNLLDQMDERLKIAPKEPTRTPPPSPEAQTTTTQKTATKTKPAK